MGRSHSVFKNQVLEVANWRASCAIEDTPDNLTDFHPSDTDHFGGLQLRGFSFNRGNINKQMLINTNPISINAAVISCGRPQIGQPLVGVRVDQVSTGTFITTSIVVDKISTPDPRWIVVKTTSGSYYSVIILPEKIS